MGPQGAAGRPAPPPERAQAGLPEGRSPTRSRSFRTRPPPSPPPRRARALEPVLEEALKAVEAYNFRVSTGQLNRLIQDALFARPYSTKGKNLKIYYATQVAARPPTFALFCNDPEIMHFSYQRYLLNRIREALPLAGTPVRLVLKSSHRRPDEAPPRRTTSRKREDSGQTEKTR